MQKPPVIYQIIHSWNIDDIVDLYRYAGWWKDTYDPAEIPSLIKGSFIFAVGVDSDCGKAVAMGRILSDRVKVGYIQDLCVLPDMRGHHIGSGLLQFLIQSAKNCGLSSIHLIAEPDTSSFYEKSGFRSEKGMIFFNLTSGGMNEN
jgi:ribosomal protein S18 acetylase RimI-like enzyme